MIPWQPADVNQFWLGSVLSPGTTDITRSRGRPAVATIRPPTGARNAEDGIMDPIEFVRLTFPLDLVHVNARLCRLVEA